MKKLLIVSCICLALASCTNRNITQERQDSIDAAAAADSMLKDATKDDTTTVDKVGVDTSDTKGL